MIPDDEVKQLFWNGQRALAGRMGRNEKLPTQFFRGRAANTWDGQPPGSCVRHKAVLDTSGVIAEYCFSCFKVTVEPRTVVELFKLMVVMQRENFPEDNTRKCIVETREQCSGFYKGFVYSREIDDANKIAERLRYVVAEEISPHIRIDVKRGCSEFGLLYPDYPQVRDGVPVMVYPEDWRTIEQDAEKQIFAEDPQTSASNNQPGFTLNDARIMVSWLGYAATVGDLSYMKISGQVLPPYPNIRRPEPFSPPCDP